MTVKVEAQLDTLAAWHMPRTGVVTFETLRKLAGEAYKMGTLEAVVEEGVRLEPDTIESDLVDMANHIAVRCTGYTPKSLARIAIRKGYMVAREQRFWEAVAEESAALDVAEARKAAQAGEPFMTKAEEQIWVEIFVKSRSVSEASHAVRMIRECNTVQDAFGIAAVKHITGGRLL